MTESKKDDLSKLSFEEALIQLENIVRELESGQIKLDDAVSAYERAVSLKKLCQDKLNAAALKIEKIEISKDGTISTTPLDTDSE
jgi:exodeoxyribonuclease VII small subunit